MNATIKCGNKTFTRLTLKDKIACFQDMKSRAGVTTKCLLTQLDV